MLRVVINAAYMSISASYGIQTFLTAPCFRGAGREGSGGCEQAGGLGTDGAGADTAGVQQSYSVMCSKDANNKQPACVFDLMTFTD